MPRTEIQNTIFISRQLEANKLYMYRLNAIFKKFL